METYGVVSLGHLRPGGELLAAPDCDTLDFIFIWL